MKTTLISPFANSILSLSAGRKHCASLSKRKIFNSLSSLQIVSKWLNSGGKHQPLSEQNGRVLWAPVFPWGELSLGKEFKLKSKLQGQFLSIHAPYCKNGVYIRGQRLINHKHALDLLSYPDSKSFFLVPQPSCFLFCFLLSTVFARETKEYNSNLDQSSSLHLKCCVLWETFFFFFQEVL